MYENENENDGTFAHESRVMSFMDSLTSLIITNVMWLVCCLPVITIGAATKAMYANVAGLLNDEPCGFMSFLRAMKKDFWRVTAVWLAVVVLAAVLAADFYLINHFPIPGKPVVLGLVGSICVMLLLFVSMVFPMASQFSWSTKKLFVNGFFLSIGNLPRMIPVVALNLCPPALLVFSAKIFLDISVFWFAAGFALIALMNYRVLNQIFNRFRN